MERRKRYYSQEEKIEIVKRCLAGESSKEAEKRTGIGSRLIRKWITDYEKFGGEGLKNKRRPGNPLAKYVNKKNLSEVEQLRYELARAEIEIAKLKKVYESERRCGRQRK
jgi:Transposase and inactivated derivatives